MRLILYGGLGMEFIIETPLSPHMAGRSTGLIAKDSLLPYMASRASRLKAGRQSPSLVPSSNHDTICAMSVQCVHPISVAPRISWTNVVHSSKNGSLYSLPTQSKSATSSKEKPICAQPAQSELATSNKCDPSVPCLHSQSGQ